MTWTHGAQRAVGALRARARTTPGRLRLLSVMLLVVLVALLVTCQQTVSSRQHAADVLADDAGTSFVAAQELRAELAGADATISRAFLAGGVEAPAQVSAYQRNIASASARIIDLGLAGGPREPLSVLSAQLPTYTGLVERARANNRIGYVVGSAYLGQSSLLMRQTILPAVDRLAADDAQAVSRGYEGATRWFQPVLVGAVGVLAVGTLVALQISLFRRTHRILNPPLVAATLLVLVVTGLVLIAFGVGRSRLVDSRDEAYRPLAVVAQARALGLRAWGDESLSLIARGNGDAYDTDARRAVERLGYDQRARPLRDGALPAAAAIDGPDASSRQALGELWVDYQKTSIQVGERVLSVGGFQGAVALARGDGTTRFDRFDDAAAASFGDSRDRFTGGLAHAADTYRGIGALSVALLAVAAVAALAGVQQRINDYR